MNRLPMYGYILLLAGLLTLGLYMMYHRRETAKKSWPSVPGKITESKIVQTTRAELQTPTVNRRMRDDKYYSDIKVWSLAVQYQYQLDGKDYAGTTATSNNWEDPVSDYPDGPSQKLHDWSMQLHRGASVSVHYNPADPSETYLVYAENPSRTMLAIGFGLLVLGILLVAAPRIF